MTSAQPDSEIATAAAEPGRAAFRRVLLKLSGEALMGDQPYGVDPARVEAIAREVTRVRRDGVDGSRYRSRQHHAIFLSETEIIFLFEGERAHEAVRALFNDPVRSTLVSHWLPLFDGPRHRAPEAYFWEGRADG